MKIEFFMIGFLASSLFMEKANYKLYVIASLIVFTYIGIKSIIKLFKDS